MWSDCQVFRTTTPRFVYPHPLPLAHNICISFVNTICTSKTHGNLAQGWSQRVIRCALQFLRHQRVQLWEYPAITQVPSLPITSWQVLPHQNNSGRMPTRGKYFPQPPPPPGMHLSGPTTCILCIYRY